MGDIVDALVIGAGPAGCASAILLAQAGWHVTLIEQSEYPRQKVCGECISAGNLELFDALGIGEAFRDMAGPELSRVGWMGSLALLAADFPACSAGAYAYGRAIGRDRLDGLLVERARSVGVRVLQPAKVRAVRGNPGNFEADIERRFPAKSLQTLHARALIDAHGSWEPAPGGSAIRDAGTAPGAPAEAPRRASDLFAFKASFERSNLSPGLLPVISLDGGYGGMVVAEGGGPPWRAASAGTDCAPAANPCRALRPATPWPNSCADRAPECARRSRIPDNSVGGSASGPSARAYASTAATRRFESATRPVRATR